MSGEQVPLLRRQESTARGARRSSTGIESPSSPRTFGTTPSSLERMSTSPSSRIDSLDGRARPSNPTKAPSRSSRPVISDAVDVPTFQGDVPDHDMDENNAMQPVAPAAPPIDYFGSVAAYYGLPATDTPQLPPAATKARLLVLSAGRSPPYASPSLLHHTFILHIIHANSWQCC
jgi:hypothetical protein